MSHSLDSLKTQAKSLRQSLAETGHNVSHAQSLELLAKQLGHRDWNTLHAKVGNAPPVLFQVGQTVRHGRENVRWTSTFGVKNVGAHKCAQPF